MPASRAREYLDADGALTLRAHVCVFDALYTAVRDRVLAATRLYNVTWLAVVDLVNAHDALAATAVTRVDGATLLHAAAREGRVDYCGLLAARGADIDADDDTGRSPLFYAARVGALAVVRWLVRDCGAQVEKRDAENRSAVFCACEEGRLRVVQFLVECGAEVGGVDYEGDTPLALAERGGHEAVVQWLTARARTA